MLTDAVGIRVRQRVQKHRVDHSKHMIVIHKINVNLLIVVLVVLYTQVVNAVNVEHVSEYNTMPINAI